MKKLFLALIALTLASCSHQMPSETKLLSFDGPSYHFSVRKVDVVDDFASRPKKRTEAKPDLSLADAMHKWVDARITHSGNVNVLEVRITDAEIVKKDIPKQKGGIEGFFTKEQTEEYDGKLSVELKLYSPERTLPVAHAEISAELSRTLSEAATLADRKALYRSMTAEIMRDVDIALDRNIRQYFAAYLQ